MKIRFHSTNFPSEWVDEFEEEQKEAEEVSIQLISPASGEEEIYGR